MMISGLELSFIRMDSPLPVFRGKVSLEEWRAVVQTVSESGGRLVSLWGTDRRRSEGDFIVTAAYGVREGLLWVELPLSEGGTVYPDLSTIFPAAGRMQRAIADLLGLTADGAADTRPWLNHNAWPKGWFPLREDSSQPATVAGMSGDYPFVRVEGEGVHEIPVGPVHAGTIEPGHFRFSVVGEKVLRLEERLGYKHRGIDLLFTRTAPLEGHHFAGRVSGDATVAFAWAYCMALESAWGIDVPQRARWLRALMLERERVANHLGDLGALGNDAAFAFGLAQFSRLKEDWLRLNKGLFGHRYLMDRVVPGGVAADLSPEAMHRLILQFDAIEAEVRSLKIIYDEHAGLQDRFLTTGRVEPRLAAQLGLAGLAGRASGQAYDLRCDYPMSPYDVLEPRMATHRAGDVAARVAVRFEELLESLRLMRGMIARFPQGEVRTEPVVHAARITGARTGHIKRDESLFGAGWIESWRGDVLVALELSGDGNAVRRCHCHDPSWQNWPVLEYAVIGNIVPDFPLINKSFNLSYSGHDL